MGQAVGRGRPLRMHISKDAFEAQQPEPGTHSNTGLSPRGLATGRRLVPPGTKRGGAAGPGEPCVGLTLKRTIDQLILPAE